MGLVAALIAILLAMRGPPFLWRGLGALLFATIAIGVAATAIAAHNAAAHGNRFGYTIGSVGIALGLQCAFMLTVYGATAGVLACVRRAPASPAAPAAAED